MANAKALLLTGLPGTGKTTLILRMVERLAGKAGGFYTSEIREHGQRAGFEIVTLDGQKAVLSHVCISSPHRVGKYGVDVEALERVGVAAIKRAIDSGHVVVVDEIGKMELCSLAFREAVLEALEHGERLLGTILLAPHAWADGIKRDSRVKLATVTRENREAVLQEVLNWLEEPLPPQHP